MPVQGKSKEMQRAPGWSFAKSCLVTGHSYESCRHAHEYQTQLVTGAKRQGELNRATKGKGNRRDGVGQPEGADTTKVKVR